MSIGQIVERSHVEIRVSQEMKRMTTGLSQFHPDDPFDGNQGQDGPVTAMIRRIPEVSLQG